MDRIDNHMIATEPKLPPPHFCVSCCNTGRQWVSKDKIVDIISYGIDFEGKSCRWGIDMFKGFMEDHCIPCRECHA